MSASMSGNRFFAIKKSSPHLFHRLATMFPFVIARHGTCRGNLALSFRALSLRPFCHCVRSVIASLSCHCEGAKRLRQPRPSITPPRQEIATLRLAPTLAMTRGIILSLREAKRRGNLIRSFAASTGTRPMFSGELFHLPYFAASTRKKSSVSREKSVFRKR